VGIGVVWLVAPYVGGLLLAPVLYVVMAPLYRRLASVVPSGIAAGLVLLTTALLIIGPSAWLVSVIVVEAPSAFTSLRESGLLNSIGSLRVGPLDVGANVQAMGGTVVSWMAGQTAALVGGAAATVLDVVIAFFGLFYLLVAGDRAWVAVRPFIPLSIAHADELLERFDIETRAMMLGTVLIALVQGSLVGVAFAVAGLPDPLLWGTVASVASMVPLVGSAIVWLPGVVALLATRQYESAVGLAAFCAVVVANMDNVLRPLVSSRVSNTHPMITLVGAFAGMRVFGLLGLVLGPLAISYFFVLLRMYRDEYGGDAVSSDSSR
jgi:predicted PurR-regulated permease PerM